MFPIYTSFNLRHSTFPLIHVTREPCGTLFLSRPVVIFNLKLFKSRAIIREREGNKPCGLLRLNMFAFEIKIQLYIFRALLPPPGPRSSSEKQECCFKNNAVRSYLSVVLIERRANATARVTMLELQIPTRKKRVINYNDTVISGVIASTNSFHLTVLRSSCRAAPRCSHKHTLKNIQSSLSFVDSYKLGQSASLRAYIVVYISFLFFFPFRSHRYSAASFPFAVRGFEGWVTKKNEKRTERARSCWKRAREANSEEDERSSLKLSKLFRR